jgi:hypothetical protein
VNMDSQPRQLHFYRNDVLLEGQTVGGFPPEVFLVATPDDGGVSVAMSFPELPSNWREVAQPEEMAKEEERRQAAQAGAAQQRKLEAEQRETLAMSLREDQVAAALDAGRFVTEWSQVLKGEPIRIESSLVAVQERPAHTGSATSVWGDVKLPDTGLHYWEVCFSMDDREPGASLGGKCFVGVVDHELKEVGNVGQLHGACGAMDEPIDSLRIDGVPTADIPPELHNSAGRCYGNEDRVGLLADMDCKPHRLYIFRNDKQLSGCTVSGFPSGVRIVACPYKPNTKVTLSFPEPPFVESEDSTDSMSPIARMRSSWTDSNAAGATEANLQRILRDSASIDPEDSLASTAAAGHDSTAEDEPETEAEEMGLPVDRDGWLEWTQTTEKGMVWKSKDVRVMRVWGEITGTNLSVYSEEERSDRKRLAVLNLSDVTSVSRSQKDKKGKDGLSFTISFSRDGQAPPTKLQTAAEVLWDFTFKVDMEMSLNKWMQALADAQRPLARWKAGINSFLDSSEDAFRADKMGEQKLVTRGHARSSSWPRGGIRTSQSLDSLSESTEVGADASSAAGPSSPKPVGASSVPTSLPSVAVSFSPDVSSSQLAVAEPDAPSPESDEQAQKSARIRTQLAQELFLTERTYVKGLEMLIAWYMEPLQASANGDGKLGVSMAQFRDIFSVVENLLMVHQMQMLEKLEQKLGGSGGAADLSVITIGDIFSDATLQTLKMHTSYANNYQKALDTLEACSKSKAFRKFCQDKMMEVAERGQNLQPLESYLITPIQRIMRYGMLLKELCKHTPANHPDKELLDVALEAVEALAQHVNESKRSSELQQKVQAVREQFEPEGAASSWPSTLQLVGPSRQYIDEGELWDVDMGLRGATGQVGNGVRRCRFFVFNDMLLKGEVTSTAAAAAAAAATAAVSAEAGLLAYRGAMLLSSDTIMRREVLHSPFLTPRGLLREGSLQREGVTPWTKPKGELHIIHVQAASQAAIYDAQRAALGEYYEQVISPGGQGRSLRASRKSRTSPDAAAEELEKFVNEHMTAPATEMGQRVSMGTDDGEVEAGAYMEFGALREHQWEAMCNRLEEEHAVRPEQFELGAEGGGATWCASKWMLVCVSEEECDVWFERLKKAVLWSNKVVEEHRKAGATRARLRNTQSMRSISLAAAGGGEGGDMSMSAVDATLLAEPEPEPAPAPRERA